MAEPAEGAKPTEAPPSGGKGPVLILAVLAALIVGAAGSMFFMMRKMAAMPAAAASAKPKAEGAEGEKAEPEEKEEHGGEEAKAEGGEGGEGEHKEGEASKPLGPPMVTMSPFVVNLTDETGDQRYLKITLAVELASKKYEKLLEAQTPRVRNAVLLYLSNLKVGDILGTQNKKALLDHLRNDVQDILGKRGVHDVYITEFVIQ